MVTLALSLPDADLAVGDRFAFEVRFHNGDDRTVAVAGPLDGSFEGMREPRWSLEFLDAAGQVVPAALGHADLGRCGMTNPLTARDVRRLQPGEDLVLRGDDLAWIPPQEVLPSSRPGTWRVRVRYEVEGGLALTPLELVSEAVPVTLRGGDAALWECRAEQLASVGRPATDASVAWLGAAPDGWTAVVASRTEGWVDGAEVSRGTLAIRPLDAALAPTSEPIPLWSGDDPGYAAAVDVPSGVLVVHTPGDGDERRLELLVWDRQPGVVARRTVRERGAGYLVAVARSGDRVAIASGAPDHLRVDVVGVDGSAIGAPTQLRGPYAGFPTLAATPDGFLVVAEAAYGEGRAQRLGRDGRELGPPTTFAFSGQTVAAARADGDAIDIVFADGGFRPDDPSDGMGLFRLRLGGVPEALSPVDQRESRFGDGAWTADGAFVRAFVEELAVRAGAGTGPTRLLAVAGGEPEVDAVGDRFVVRWTDRRDDATRACRALSECSTEGYAAILGADGALLVRPTRLTWEATPRPLAPRGDWERFCR